MRHQIKKDGVNILVDKGIQECGLGDGEAGARKLVPRTPEFSMR